MNLKNKSLHQKLFCLFYYQQIIFWHITCHHITSQYFHDSYKMFKDVLSVGEYWCYIVPTGVLLPIFPVYKNVTLLDVKPHLAMIFFSTSTFKKACVRY